MAQLQVCAGNSEPALRYVKWFVPVGERLCLHLLEHRLAGFGIRNELLEVVVSPNGGVIPGFLLDLRRDGIRARHGRVHVVTVL